MGHEVYGSKGEGVNQNSGVCGIGCDYSGGVDCIFSEYGGLHDGAYRDGTYYEEMQLGEETAEVAVTIAEGRIAAVSMEEETEAVAVFYPCWQR